MADTFGAIKSAFSSFAGFIQDDIEKWRLYKQYGADYQNIIESKARGDEHQVIMEAERFKKIRADRMLSQYNLGQAETTGTLKNIKSLVGIEAEPGSEWPVEAWMELTGLSESAAKMAKETGDFQEGLAGELAMLNRIKADQAAAEQDKDYAHKLEERIRERAKWIEDADKAEINKKILDEKLRQLGAGSVGSPGGGGGAGDSAIGGPTESERTNVILSFSNKLMAMMGKSVKIPEWDTESETIKHRTIGQPYDRGREGDPIGSRLGRAIDLEGDILGGSERIGGAQIKDEGDPISLFDRKSDIPYIPMPVRAMAERAMALSVENNKRYIASQTGGADYSLKSEEEILALVFRDWENRPAALREAKKTGIILPPSVGAPASQPVPSVGAPASQPVPPGEESAFTPSGRSFTVSANGEQRTYVLHSPEDEEMVREIDNALFESERRNLTEAQALAALTIFQRKFRKQRMVALK